MRHIRFLFHGNVPIKKKKKIPSLVTGLFDKCIENRSVSGATAVRALRSHLADRHIIKRRQKSRSCNKTEKQGAEN